LKGKIDHKFGTAHSLAVTSKYIIAGTYNRNIHVYDCQTQEYVKALSMHLGTINAVAVSVSGHFLFSASGDATIQIWDLDNMLPIQTLARHEAGVNTLVLHGDFLMSGSEDTEIKVFRHFKIM